MEFDNSFGDVESDAGAFDTNFSGVLGAKEFGEKTVKLIGGDANALIGDRGVDGAFFVISADTNDDFALGCIFDGIINKIIEDFLDTRDIDRDRAGEIWRRIEMNLEAFVGGKDAEFFYGLGN